MTASKKALRIEALLWIGVMVAAVILSTLLVVHNNRLRNEIDALQIERETLTAQIADLQERLAAQEGITLDQPGLLPWELEELQKKGLADPIRDLVADLQKHPELIPHEGVLGGTMAFGFPQKIHVLTDRYVLAYFEDGHIAGWMLLTYDVARGGRITWQRIDSYVE
jgi:hypothetical protein